MALGIDYAKDSVFNQKFDIETCDNVKCKEENGCGAENCKTDEIYRNYMGITQEELNELKERTSIDNLKCEDEVEYYKTDTENPLKNDLTTEMSEEASGPNSPLVSVEKRWEMSNVTKTEFPRSYFKYCNHEWYRSGDKMTKSKLTFDNLQFPTIVACVKVYHPFLSHRERNVKVKLLQEIHILGEQTLAQLKDKIVCSLDHIGDKDMSNECFLKEVGYNVTAQDEYPSSFIFIENTFYNDTRTKNMKDLSKELRSWAAEKKLGEFETAEMHKTRIDSLKVRLGRPYVYLHQGNCEHIILFSDIRLLDSSDPNRFSLFPKIHCTGRLYGKHCMMCSDFYARWLVVGNERLTHDKAYLCNKCFISYNYVNGKKVGNFRAYKYVDPVAIL